MPFQALTDAPVLREGITLNIMAVPQREGNAPERIAVGAKITLRFGHCCPLIREGKITEVDANGAVLALDGSEWSLAPRSTGIEIPGIVSENWIVTHRAA